MKTRNVDILQFDVLTISLYFWTRYYLYPGSEFASGIKTRQACIPNV